MANTNNKRKTNTTKNTSLDNETVDSVKETAKKYTEDELNEAIEKAVAKALKNNNVTQTTVNVVQDESISVIYIGCISKGTSVKLGSVGSINKAGVIYEFSKKDFLRKITPMMEKMLASRELLVVGGLTVEERQRYNIYYGDEEVISEEEFYHLLDYSEDKLCEKFSKLCPQHKEIVAQMIYTAYSENSDSRVTLDKCRKLNAISKEDGGEGLFANIIKNIGGNLE